MKISGQTRDFIPTFDTDVKYQSSFLLIIKKGVIGTFFAIDRDAFSINVSDKIGRLVMKR